MRVYILLFIPIIYMHVINLVILYEKTGLQEIKEMYYYIIEKLIEKFNDHLQRRGITIRLLDFLAYDDYLTKPEYKPIAMLGGEENLTIRLNALKNIPVNIILMASASPEEKDQIFSLNSPCTSRLISNITTGNFVNDGLLMKITYSIFDWMKQIFKTDIPNPMKEKDSDVFDRFAKEASKSEFVENLKKCSKDIKRTFEAFTKKMNWENVKLKKLYSESEDDVDISSPLNWVLSNSKFKEEKNLPKRNFPDKKQIKQRSEEVDDVCESKCETNKKNDTEKKGTENSFDTNKDNDKKKEAEPKELKIKNMDEKVNTRNDDIKENNIPNIEEKIKQELKKIIEQNPYISRKLHETPSYLNTNRKIQDNFNSSLIQTNIPKRVRDLSYGRVSHKRTNPAWVFDN